MKRRLPHSLVLAVQLSSEFRGMECQGSDFRWYPDSTMSLEDFLFDRLFGSFDGGVAILEWRPCTSRFPEMSKAALDDVKRALDRCASERATIRYWGRRWFTNAAANTLAIGKTAFLESPGTQAALVVCSGPSAEEVLNGIREIPSASRPMIVCVSSALAACVWRSVVPDFVVATDPGFWGARHLDRAFPCDDDQHPIIAAPLTASLPAAARSLVLPLDTALPYEAGFLGALDCVALRCRPSGTVSGTALSLALTATTGPVFVCGLDLASSDIVSHASPSAFDPYVDGFSDRLKPSYSKRWERGISQFPVRSGRFRIGRPYSVYSSEIGRMGFTRSVTRIAGSPVRLDSMIELEAEGFMKTLRAEACRGGVKVLVGRHDAPGSGERAERVRGIVLSWRERAICALESCGNGSLDRDGLSMAEAFGGRACAGFMADIARGGTGGAFLQEALLATRRNAELITGGLER
ncbi:MAG: DUF115 domain-containing protein [Spirochaetes bacterium]|nr:DUF115 domain-containing protein [Spirochaetota bacterium]